MCKFAAIVVLALASGCTETRSMQSHENFIGSSIHAVDIEKFGDELPEMKLPRIVIEKAKRQLTVFDGEKLIKTFKISLGFSPTGDKEHEGDGRTPEGEFYVYIKNPKSKFYLSLGISYHGVDDAERGLRAGLISKEEHDAIVDAVRQKKMPPQDTALGGLIYLHGGGAGKDRTYGCAALADEDIRQLFNAIPIGTPVTILP